MTGICFFHFEIGHMRKESKAHILRRGRSVAGLTSLIILQLQAPDRMWVVHTPATELEFEARMNGHDA